MHLDKQKQVFRIINSGLDAVMKVKWPRMESVSPGAQLSWHPHPQCLLKAWVPCEASEPRTDLQLLQSSWWHAGPAGRDDRHFSADISQGKAWDARVGPRSCVLETWSEGIINIANTR